MLCRDMYAVIASYLGCIETIRCLDGLCSESTDLCNCKEQLKIIVKAPKQKRLMIASEIGCLDGVIEYWNVKRAHEAFMWSNCNGHQEISKWIRSKSKLDIHASYDKAFLDTCFYGQAKIAIWLHRIDSMEPAILLKGFKKSCKNKQVECALDLYDACWSNMPSKLTERAFRIACSHGYMELALRIYNMNTIGDHALDEGFVGSCKNGHIECAQAIYALRDDIHNIVYNIIAKAFCLACSNGHIDIVIWLHDTNELRDDIVNQGFVDSCWGGHLSCIQAICAWSNNDISKNIIENGFYALCRKDHQNIAQWLYVEMGSKCDIILARSNELFWMHCFYGQLDMAQWLYGLGGVNINSYQCINGIPRNRFKPHIIQWLRSLNCSIGDYVSFYC